MRGMLGGLAMAALVLAGCGGGDAATPPRRTTAADTAQHAKLLATGKQVYAGHCSACHRLLGKRTPADPPPDAYGVSFDEIVVPQSYVVDRITNGFGGMQSFSGELTTAQIRAVAAYVTSVGGRDVRAQRPPDAAQLTAGKSVFATRCARCHQLAGTPATDPPSWPPTDFDVVKPSAAYVASLLDGSGNRFLRSFMRRLRGQLSSPEIRAVAAYVSQTAGAPDGRP